MVSQRSVHAVAFTFAMLFCALSLAEGRFLVQAFASRRSPKPSPASPAPAPAAATPGPASPVPAPATATPAPASPVPAPATATPAPSTCSEPRQGIWRVEHLVPNPETGSLVTAGWSVLHLQKEFDGVFSGSGAGVSLTAAVGAVENRGTLSYRVLAIFDPETCTLSGTLYNLVAPLFADPIVWKYDGEAFEGSCVSAENGELVFQAKCGHRLTFVE